MNRKLLLGIACVMLVAVLGSLGAAGSKEASVKSNQIDNLVVYFVPSRDPGEIITVTAPLKNLLIQELGKQGYDVKNVEIAVGTTYEAVGEAMSAGTADIGIIPGGTYVTYDDGAEVILTATRDGLSKDFDEPSQWNDGKPTEATTKQAVGYRSIIIAGPSAKGKALVAKVNAGQKLSFEDLSSANWAVMGSTSSAGYIYPTIWMQQNYGKKLTDLAHVVQADSYASAMARLASGQIDIMVTYADARRDYESKWTTDFGRSASIWAETGLVGVTPMIYNDTISVSKASDLMTDAFKKALQQAFIDIASTEEGQKVIAIYSHKGYVPAVSADYDNERAAQKLLKGL